jgi:hypothetical protein
LTFTAGLTLADPLALVEEAVADELPLSVEVAEEFVWLPDEIVTEEVAADEGAEVLDEVSVVLVDPDDPVNDPAPSEIPPEPPLVLPPVPPPVSPLVALPPVALPPATPPELA